MTGPQNIEYERFVLGACLLYPELLHAARPTLTPDDFSLEDHRRVWLRITDLYDVGHGVDRGTVWHALNQHGQGQACGGLTGLVTLTEGVPQVANLDAYVHGVKDAALLRSIISASQHTINRCMEGVETPQAILDSLGQTALTLRPQECSAGLRSVAEIIDSVGILTPC